MKMNEISQKKAMGVYFSGSLEPSLLWLYFCQLTSTLIGKCRIAFSLTRSLLFMHIAGRVHGYLSFNKNMKWLVDSGSPCENKWVASHYFFLTIYNTSTATFSSSWHKRLLIGWQSCFFFTRVYKTISAHVLCIIISCERSSQCISCPVNVNPSNNNYFTRGSVFWYCD